MTNQAECARCYGSQKNHKLLIGTVEEVTSSVTKTGRTRTYVTADFVLGGNVTKKSTLNIQSVKTGLHSIIGTASGHPAIKMPLTLSMRNINILKTWVDAANTLHGDMTSHTGGITMMGKGALNAKSSKQKLNTKS